MGFKKVNYIEFNLAEEPNAQFAHATVRRIRIGSEGGSNTSLNFNSRDDLREVGGKKLQIALNQKCTIFIHKLLISKSPKNLINPTLKVQKFAHCFVVPVCFILYYCTLNWGLKTRVSEGFLRVIILPIPERSSQFTVQYVILLQTPRSPSYEVFKN